MSAAQIWCFPAISALLPLQDCKRSFQDNRGKQCKSGTAISPENESYFWSLYQTAQSLPAFSDQPGSYLTLEMRIAELRFPSPAAGWCSVGVQWHVFFFFPSCSFWPETCTKSSAGQMRYLIPHSGAQVEQQQKLIFVNESKISSLLIGASCFYSRSQPPRGGSSSST